MSVDLEKILYKERMFKKELRREGYEEAVMTIRGRHAGEIASLIVRVVESGKVIPALVISEALLRAPLLHYKLALEFLGKGVGEVSQLLNLGKTLVRDLSRLYGRGGEVSEQALEGLVECSRFSMDAAVFDVKRCREDHISSLLNVSPISAKLLSSIFSLALAPVDIRLDVEEMVGRKSAVLWPYVAKLSSNPWKITLHRLEDEVGSALVDMPGEPVSLRSAALRGGMALLASVREGKDFLYFLSLTGKVSVRGGEKICVDHDGVAHVLRHDDGRILVSQYNVNGVEIYRKPLGASARGVRSTSCAPLIGGGAVFALPRPGRTIFVISREGTAQEFSLDSPADHVVPLPLNLVVAYAENEVVVVWLLPRRGDVEIIKERAPSGFQFPVDRLLAVPHLGILAVSGRQTYVVNALGAVRQVLWRSAEPPLDLEAIPLPTFSVISLTSGRGNIDRIFLSQNGRITPVDPALLGYENARGIVHSYNTVCLVFEKLLRCFSPIYLKLLAYSRAGEPAEEGSTRGLLSLYDTAATLEELVKVLLTARTSIGAPPSDSLVYRLSSVMETLRRKTGVQDFGFDRLIQRLSMFDAPLKILGLQLLELADRIERLQRVAKARELIQVSNDLLRGRERAMLNADVFESLVESYAVLGNSSSLLEMDPATMFRYLEKFRQSAEFVGLEDPIATYLGKIDGGEAVKVIVRKLFQLAEGGDGGVVKRMALSHLRELGLNLDMIAQELAKIDEEARKIRLENYRGCVENRIRSLIATGDTKGIELSLRLSLDIVHDIQEIYEKYSSLPCAAEVIARSIGEAVNCVNSESSLALCRSRLREFKSCIESLCETHSKILSLAQSASLLRVLDVHALLAGATSCDDKLRRARDIMLSVERMKAVVERLEEVLRDIERLEVKPRAAFAVMERVKARISRLDVNGVVEELNKLVVYRQLSIEFNEALYKLRNLAEALSLEGIDAKLGEMAQALTDLDIDRVSSKELESLKARVKNWREIDVERLREYAVRLREAAALLGLSTRLIDAVSSEFFARLLTSADSVAWFLERVKQLSTQRTMSDDYMKLVDSVASVLRELGVGKELVTSLQRNEKSACAIGEVTVADLVAKLEARARCVHNRTLKAKDLLQKIRQVQHVFHGLEEELRRPLLGLLTALIQRTRECRVETLLSALEEFITTIEIAKISELKEKYEMVKRGKVAFKSEGANLLVRALTEVFFNKLGRQDFGGALDCLLTLLEAYEAFLSWGGDAVVYNLEREGFRLSEYFGIEINDNNYRESARKLIAGLKKLASIKDFLNACPSHVLKLLNASKKDVDTVIKTLRLVRRMEPDTRKLCRIIDKTASSSVEDFVIETLASLGEELLGAREPREEEKLALSFSILVNYLRGVVREFADCGSVAENEYIPRRICGEFYRNGNLKKSLVYLALACAERDSYECKRAAELLGGYHATQLINAVEELTARLGVGSVDRLSAVRLIEEKVCYPIVLGGSQGFKEVERNVNRVRETLSMLEREPLVLEVLRRLEHSLKKDVARLIELARLYVDFKVKGHTEGDEMVIRVYGEINENRESTLQLEMCSKLPIPVFVHGVTVNFVDVNLVSALPLRERWVDPRKCEVVSLRIPKMVFSISKLELGKEAAARVHVKYSLLGLKDVGEHVTLTYVPVKYSGFKGELMDIVLHASANIRDVEIDISRLSDTLLGVGGNNIVVLGVWNGERVVVKMPVFYKDIAMRTSIKEVSVCYPLAWNCVKATKECSSKSVAEVYKIEVIPPYAVERYIEGVTLRSLLLERRRLSVDDAKNVAMRIGEALMCLHSHGVYHNDIRPENVIVRLSGGSIAEVYLIDSCVDGVWDTLRRVARVDFKASKLGNIIDERYLPPDLRVLESAPKETQELESQLELHRLIDVYQLGLLVSEMMLGYNPLVVTANVEELRELIASAQPHLGEIILKALQPRKSGMTLRDFISALEKM